MGEWKRHSLTKGGKGTWLITIRGEDFRVAAHDEVIEQYHYPISETRKTTPL